MDGTGRLIHSRYGIVSTDLRFLALMTEEEAEELIHVKYWFKKAELLPNGLDYFYFDSCVVHGEETATRWLYLSLGYPPRSQLLMAELEHIDVKWAINGIERYRKRNLKLRPDWNLHGQGKLNRVIRARTRAFGLLKEAGELV